MNKQNPQVNMIKQQIQTWGVNDTKVLDLLLHTPRHNYTPSKYAAFAYTDMEIPLPYGEVMLLPQIEAKMLQSLEIQTTDKILEIGTGSGYLTALLAKLGKSVVTVDVHEEFSTCAKHRHKSNGIYNIRYEVSDAAKGFNKGGPYDIIVITGGLRELPSSFKKQLNVGGKIFALLGQNPNLEGTLIKHPSADGWSSQVFFETSVPMLQGVPEKEAFTF